MSSGSGFDERDLSALRRAYRSLLTERSDACPDGDAMVELVAGDLPGEERERLADHIVACRSCASDYRRLREVHALASARIRPAHSRRPIWIAVAACTLAVAGTLIAVRSARHGETLRGAAAEAASAVTPPDGVALDAPPPVFRWPAQKGAEGYRVRLFSSAGDELWQADAGLEDRIAVPAAVAGRLPRGAGYFWTVEVRLALETQRLGPYTFSLKR